MNKTMKKIFSTILISCFIFLSACQNTAKTKHKTINAQEQVNALLRSITIQALKTKEYAQAQRSINALILNDKKTWKFVSSALIALPKDAAYEVLEQAQLNPQTAASDNQLLSIAKVYISFKDTEKGLQTINQALQINPKNLEARYFRARLQTVLKKYQPAEQDFKYITKNAPKNQTYIDQYASFLQETQRFDEAQSVLARLKPTAENLFKRIIFALQNKNQTLALESYQKLKNISPTKENSNQLNFTKAEAAYWLEKDAESLHYYQQVKGGEHFLDAREVISVIYYRQKQYEQSLEILHQLQNAEEKYAIKAYATEAHILKEQGQTEQALEKLTQGIDILPNKSDLLYERALIYSETANIKLAEKDFQAILKKDANNFQALNALGYTWADNDMNLEKAHQYIQKANELDPDNAAVLDSLGWVQYKLGHYTKAEQNFKKAIAKEPNDPELFIHQFKTQIKLNNTKAAKATLEKAMQLFPENKKLQKLYNSNPDSKNHN